MVCPGGKARRAVDVSNTLGSLSHHSRFGAIQYVPWQPVVHFRILCAFDEIEEPLCLFYQFRWHITTWRDWVDGHQDPSAIKGFQAALTLFNGGLALSLFNESAMLTSNEGSCQEAVPKVRGKYVPRTVCRCI